MATYINDLFTMAPNAVNHLSFHQALITDRRRLNAFCRAVKRAVCPGDLVMDVGVGTGVLSMAALQAGARKVVCIDEDDIILFTRDIFRKNNCLRKTQLIRGNLLQIRFSGTPPDIVVAELLGSFALGENITEIMFYLLRQFPSLTRTVPEWFELIVAPVEDDYLNRAIREFEEPLPGMDLTPLARPALNNVYVRNVNKNNLLSDPEILAHVKLVELTDPDLKASVVCTVTKPGIIHGIAGWFRSGLWEGIKIETGPFFPRMHWEDVIFPIDQPVAVKPGDKIKFQLVALCHSSGDCWSWKIEISRRGKVLAKCMLNTDHRLPKGRMHERWKVKLK